MTPTFVAALIVGWIVVSCLVCVAICMASSRFSARAEQLEVEREPALPRRARAHIRHTRRPVGVRLDSSTGPVKAKVI